MNDLTAATSQQFEYEQKKEALKLCRTRPNESQEIMNVLLRRGLLELQPVSPDELEKWRKVEPPICTIIHPCKAIE